MNADKVQVRNTQQRKYMLELLRSTNTHPNALWLYEQMKPCFPNLSFSTVYRNLGILEREGELQRLSCGNTFDRYDGNTMPHSHFFCRKCGEVYDVSPGAMVRAALSEIQHCQHSVEGCSVTYYGVCKNCLKAEPNNH